jgi:hypothetical protein
MKMLFLRANSIEKVGVILKSAPVPRDLSPDEKKAYTEVLEEKALEAMDKALPLYEQAIKTAEQLGIATSPYLEKARERIKEINPSSQVLAIQIQPHQYKQTAAAPAAAAAPGAAVKEIASAPKDKVEKENAESGETPGSPALAASEGGSPAPAANFRDDQFARNMKRIQNIMQMDLAVDDKVKQLKRIEIEAQREIQTEEEKIQELKKKP